MVSNNAALKILKLVDKDYFLYFCKFCDTDEWHIKRGFRGHNERYQCMKCGEINYDENN